MKAKQGVRVPGVVAAGLLGMLAGVVACGSDAPDEKIGEGLGASKGTVVTLKAEGEGADQALDELVGLLETDLDAE